MAEKDRLKLLFIVNAGAGKGDTDWPKEITNYFESLPHEIEIFQLPENGSVQSVSAKIMSFSPKQVIAVGGDGTVKMIAECLVQKNISLGILPAGSANGLAKELGISEVPSKALDVLITGFLKRIHLVRINDQLCIHLSDIGLNAYAMKKFESQDGRGMWGYLVASLKVLWNSKLMEVEMLIDKKPINTRAAIVVIANGTRYGTGAVINPTGKLDDEVFEVIAVKKISVYEIFKMFFSHAPYNLDKTEIFQTATLSIRSVKKVHFQVDGEYLGKVHEVKAELIPDALELIVPAPGLK